MDRRRHQPQHAARALKPLQRRPVAIEPVERFRVDRVARPHALFVAPLAAFGGKLVRGVAVKRAERTACVVARGQVLDRQEQPPAHHLKALLGADRFPDRLHAAEYVCDALQRAPARLAADFDVGFGDGGHENGAAAGADRFRQLLHKGLQSVETARRQPVDAVNLARIGHQLVDQDQARPAGVEQRAQGVGAGRRALAVGRAHEVVELAVARLPHELRSDFAPQRADCDAGQVRRPPLLRRIERRPHQDRDARPRPPADPRFVQQPRNVRQTLQRRAAGQEMEKRQQRMRLAAAERRFQLDDRFAAQPVDAPQRLGQQTPQPHGHVGAREKLHRILIFGRRRAAHNLRQVRRELRLPVAPRRHVGVGARYFAPRAQPPARNRRQHAAVGACHFFFLRPRRCLGALVGRRRGGGAFRAVAHRPRQRPQPLRRFRVDALDKPRHRVERAPRVVVSGIDEPLVRPAVAGRLQLVDPCAVLAAQTAPEYVVPLHVHQEQAARDVERGDQLPVLAVFRQAAPLLLVENIPDALVPPLVFVARAQRGRDPRRQRLGQNLEAFRYAPAVRGHGATCMRASMGAETASIRLRGIGGGSFARRSGAAQSVGCEILVPNLRPLQRRVVRVIEPLGGQRRVFTVLECLRVPRDCPAHDPGPAARQPGSGNL